MLAFTADELLTVFRAEVSDQADPPLWADSELYVWVTEAWDAMLKKTELQFKVIQLPVVANEQKVPLPASVLNIRSARLVETNTLLSPANTNTAGFATRNDYGMTTVEMFGGTGRPGAYVRDYERRALRLIPTPNADMTLEIQCTTTVSAPLQAGMLLPSADAEDQRLVLHFIKWRAYAKHDADTESLVRARYYEDAYRRGVEDRASSLRNQRRTPGVIRMEW